MFSFRGLLKTLGVVMIFFISASFLLGFFSINHVALSLSILYILCYVLNGVLCPIWNPETPYFASYIASVTLTLLNLLFAVFVLDIMVLAEPIDVNKGMVRNSIMSLIVTFVVVKMMNRKQRIQHD
jgi:hypothetical protein